MPLLLLLLLERMVYVGTHGVCVAVIADVDASTAAATICLGVSNVPASP
jgi:hypothetical protein